MGKQLQKLAVTRLFTPKYQNKLSSLVLTAVSSSLSHLQLIDIYTNLHCSLNFNWPVEKSTKKISKNLKKNY